MAISVFSVTVTGQDKVVLGVAALNAAIQNLTPFWRDVWAPKYFAMVQDSFATGGRPRNPGGQFSGGAWAKLSPKYRIWKNQNYPGQPILVRTGALRESVRWGGQGLGAHGIFHATAQSVVAGTSIPYGQYHHTGTSTMPQRNFLPAPDPAQVSALMHAWIVKTAQTAAGA